MSGFELFLYGIVLLIVLATGRRLYLQWKIPHISAAELSKRVAEGEKVLFLDVRTVGERSQSSIPGSIHLPLAELRRRIGELEKYRKREIVVYCQSGNRSLSAAAKLEKAGFRATNLKGGISDWNFTNRTSRA